MKVYYDFHIHSALSPCSDDDMTPNNIVNMAKIKGLDVIAITDHNSCKNLKPFLQLGEELGILVVPGMELQSKEDVHVLCLFRDIESALEFNDYVYSKLPDIKNKEEIFGNQLIFNEKDEIIGYEEKMLLSSTNITFDEAYNMVKQLNGAFIPCHVDKEAFSVISNLGFIPDYLDIKTLECVKEENLIKYSKLGLIKRKYRLIKNSDAHNLGLISERENYIEIDELTIDCIIDELLK